MILLCVCVGQRNLFISASPLSLKLSWPGSRRKIKKPGGITERGLHTSRVSLGSGRGGRFKMGLNESVTGRKSMSDHPLGVRESERKGVRERRQLTVTDIFFPPLSLMDLIRGGMYLLQVFELRLCVYNRIFCDWYVRLWSHCPTWSTKQWRTTNMKHGGLLTIS